MPAVSVHISGIKCDAPGCDYRDDVADFSKPEEWLDKKCPKCDSPLLTEEDYRAILSVQAAVALTALELPLIESDELVTVGSMHMDGSGKIDMSEIEDWMQGGAK